ncbi:MAG TPA: acyl-CoA dehydrogenase, partial [Thermoanaerobaculia bacterium]|nr:acyl-CoA dehydrogenase [Thermoanaerobaculia bacterium]
RAQAMREAGLDEADKAAELADLFCRNARRKVARLFRALWANDDARKYKVAMKVLDGQHSWLEAGILDLGARAEAMRPDNVFGGKAEPEPMPRVRPVGTN